jgi:phenylpropionate dioxygenase-like ring-hydroxylating dioxygenase large terminal subunit
MEEQSIRMPGNATAARTPRPKPHFLRMPAEGEGGVFTQSWFPVALASEVVAGQILGVNFLDGKIVVFRAPDGTPRAMSAYCPHLGADLSVGRIVDGRMQCAFHHWEYDAEGYSVKTGIGDPPPKSACLFLFPVQERFGIIWVFNGEEPLFDLPQLPHADSELVWTAYRFGQTLNCDPWVFAANTPDMQHLKVVHKIRFETEEPHDLVQWHDWGFEFSYRGLHRGTCPSRTRQASAAPACSTAGACTTASGAATSPDSACRGPVSTTCSAAAWYWPARSPRSNSSPCSPSAAAPWARTRTS